MPARSWALVRRGAACAAAAAAIAGCGTTSSKSDSSVVTVSGHDLTVYVSEPASIGSDPNLQDVAYAEQLAFAQGSSRVTGYKLQMKVVRGATLSDNARTAIQDTSAIAYLGELQPGASLGTVGITQAVDLLQLSPTDTTTPADSDFESLSTYKRNFVRVAGDDAAQGSAIVAELRALGASNVYVAADGSRYGDATAAAVRSAARSASVSVTADEAGAGAIFYGSDDPTAAARFFASAASAAPRAVLFGPSALYTPALVGGLSPAVRRLYVSVPGTLPSVFDASGRAFRRAFVVRYGHVPSVQAYLGYEAMSGLISVLAKAGGDADNRTDVIKDAEAHQFGGSGFVIARLARGSLVPWRTAPTI